jgi:hypothetical protein
MSGCYIFLGILYSDASANKCNQPPVSHLQPLSAVTLALSSRNCASAPLLVLHLLPLTQIPRHPRQLPLRNPRRRRRVFVLAEVRLHPRPHARQLLQLATYRLPIRI